LLHDFESGQPSWDLLDYMAEQPGQLTDHRIGERFSLTYSAAGRKVGVFKDLLKKNMGM